MPESFDDHLSRVQCMAGGAITWDLSPNDIAALAAVLEDRKRLREQLAISEASRSRLLGAATKALAVLKRRALVAGDVESLLEAAIAAEPTKGE